MRPGINIIRILILFGLFATSWFLASISIDPDFGWRLQIGKYILSHGIPVTDPYSYTMPSFRFVDHEWLTHGLMYLAYKVGGYRVLAFLIAAVYTATIALATKHFKNYWLYAHVLLIGMVLLHYFAVKPQVLAWLYTVLFIGALLSPRWKYIYKFQMPFFFLLWANTHASFVYGIGIYTIWVVCDFKKNRNRSECVLLAISVAATFINPYGWRIWEEIMRTGSDARLRWYVLEWMPQFLHIGLSSFIITAWYLTIVIRYWKQMTLFEKIVASTGFGFGMSSSRNFPLWIITVSPIVARLLGIFTQEAEKNRITRSRMKKLSVGFLLCCLAITAFELFFITKEDISYSEEKRYPKAALVYLIKRKVTGNMFTAYEWGGYFIWKYPGKKVFIDGRMPSWRQSKISHPQESPDALKEYIELIAADKTAAQTLKKYHIRSVVLPIDFLGNKQHNSFNKQKFIVLLKKHGMKQVYKDTTAVIFSL